MIRILLVEDDTSLRSSLRFVLLSGGYEVLEAGDGLEALKVLEREHRGGNPLDLLITDLRMPEMNGMELLHALEADGMKVPSIVISGHGDRSALIDLLRLGCADFLAKPFEPDEVLGKVASVLERLARKKETAGKQTADLRDATELLDRQARSARMDMESLEQEVNSAARAYRELMSGPSHGQGLDVELRNRTYKQLGGDFAGTDCQGDICRLLVADVAGHDLAASYQTILIKSFFDEYCRTAEDGTAFFEGLNGAIRESGSNERMVTALLVHLDMNEGRGQVISAGHPSLIRYDPEAGRADMLSGQGDVLGLHERVEFTPMSFDIRPGDRYFLYTDGLTGARNVDGASGRISTLSLEGLMGLVESYGSQPLSSHVDAIWKHAMEFCRGKQADDMLLMGVKTATG